MRGEKGPRRRRPVWRRLLLPLLVVLVLNLIGLATYTAPRLVRDRTLEARAAQLQEDLEAERAGAARLRERSGTIRANERELKRLLDEVIPSREAGLLQVIEAVENAASEAGLRLVSRRYAPAQLETFPVERYDMTMPVQGSYEELVAFIEGLERSPHFLVIERLQLRDGGSERATEDELDVVISTYFRTGDGVVD